MIKTKLSFDSTVVRKLTRKSSGEGGGEGRVSYSSHLNIPSR